MFVPQHGDTPFSIKTGNYSVVLSLVPKDIIIQKHLFDAQWHSVVIVKRDNGISVTVDASTTANLTDAGISSMPNKDIAPVYFGGLALPTKFTFGVKAKNNFVGCLQQIQYNKVSSVFFFNFFNL